METRFRGARRPRVNFGRGVGGKSEGVNFVSMENSVEKESPYKDLKKLKTSYFPSLDDTTDSTEHDDIAKKMKQVILQATDQTNVMQPITDQTSVMQPITNQAYTNKTSMMQPVMLPATEDLELDCAQHMAPSLPENNQFDTELKSVCLPDAILKPDSSLLGASGMLAGQEKIFMVPDLPSPEEETDTLDKLKKSENQMQNTPDFKSLQQPSDSTGIFGAESEDTFLSVQTKNKKAFAKKPRTSTVSSVPREDLNYKFVQHELKQLDHFVPNTVQYTTAAALNEFVDCLPWLESGTHGCMVQEGYRPDGGQYMEDVHFVTEKNLGRGSFGNVDLAVDSSSGRKLVRKQIEKSQLMKAEIIIPLHLDSQHVTKIIGLIQRQTENSVRMELLLEYAGSALNVYLIQEGKDLTPVQIWGLTKQALKGLTHIHNYGMIHLDIKPENLCIQEVNGELRLKITDFGSAKLPYEDITFNGWTPEYMAQEGCQYYLQKMQGVQFAAVLKQEDITGKVDVFALFLVIGYMYGKKHVLLSLITQGRGNYHGMTAEEKKRHQLQLIVMMATNGADVDALINDGCDLDMRDLLMKMSYPMKDRVTAREALDIVERREFNQERLERERELKHQQFSQQLQRRQAEVHYVTPETNKLCLPATVQPEITLQRSIVKDKLREKLMPYKKNQHPPESPKTPLTPMEEMQKLQIRTSKGKLVQEQGQHKTSLHMVAEEQSFPVTETARASNMTTRPSVEPSRPAPIVTTPAAARNMPAPALLGIQTTSPEMNMDYDNFIDLKTPNQECSELQGNIPMTVFDF